MLGLGLSEILVVAVVILLVVGPDRLPQFMRMAGRGYGHLRRSSEELRKAFVIEADRADAEERYQELEAQRRKLHDARQGAVEQLPGGVAQDPGLVGLPKEDPDGEAADEAGER